MFAKWTVLVLVAVLSAAQVRAIDKARLRFKLSAKGLPDKDTLGTIDPYVELWVTEFGGSSPTKIGRTDTITDNENPDWGTVFEFDFDRSKAQKWNFRIYDHDNGREDDKGGSCWVDVADYVDKGQIVNANLDKKGYLTIRSADNQQPSSLSGIPGQLPLPAGTPDTLRLRFKLSANGISAKDDIGFIQGQSDAYVEIFVADGPTGRPRKIGRTGTVSGSRNPSWGESFEHSFDRNKDQRFQFKIWDDDNFREDDKVGLAWVEVNDYVSHGQVYTTNLNKKGSLTISRADGLPPNPYVPPSQLNPNAGFVQPTNTRGTVPVVAPPQNINNNQPQSFNNQHPQSPPPQVIATSPQQLTTLRFKLSARNLEDRDIIGTSDPYVKVYVTQDGRSEELLRTSSKLSDNENPEWPDIFELRYDPSKHPRLRFLILDEDDNRRDDELGNTTVDVSDIVQRSYITSNLPKKGTLTVTRI